MKTPQHLSDSAELSVDDIRYEANLLEQEARMILPGIQTLFGFQLVAVFNAEFFHRLTRDLQTWHIVSIGLTVLAMGLAIAPAAYNRSHATHTVTTHFVHIANTWLRWTLMPLALAIAIDFALIVMMVSENGVVSIGLGVVVSLFLLLLWYAYPTWAKPKRV